MTSHTDSKAAGDSGASPDGAPWVEQLAQFMAAESEVRAIRLDPGARKVSVATVGRVDAALLRQKLEEVLRAASGRLEAEAKRQLELPVGVSWKVSSQKQDAAAILEKASCATAPKFWTWREYELPEPEEAEEGHGEEWKLLAALAGTCAVLMAAGFAAGRLGWGPAWLPAALYGGAMLAGGWDAAVDTWENLRRGKLDIHFLMLAVAAGASAVGAYGEGALLLFLFSTSGALEAFAMHRTQREIRSLLHASPKVATRVRDDGGLEPVPVSSVAIGWNLQVKPGDLFPVDGEVLTGKTAADESNLTGESVPVPKAPGDEVSSGTLNLWGAVTVRVTRLASQSTLQRIIQLIQSAQRMRAPSQRFTDRFGTGYTYGVLGLTAVVFLFWWLGRGVPAFAYAPDGGYPAFYRAMTLLVVMSPCALVLSIPSAILAAIAWGARHGVLFRGGAAIEKLAEVDVVALDKTGTLTTGDLRVVAVESFPAGRENAVLELACALERNSHHPIARAITSHGRRQGVRIVAVEEFESITGQGLRGSVGQASVVLGRRELLEGGPLAGWMQSVPPPPAHQGEVWVIHQDLIGRILLQDEVRTQSRPTLARLAERGIRTIMLTGDRRASAEAVARELGVGECRAGLKPEDKVAAIQELTSRGHRVAMVGDGVNDAPSLAAAHVSVAMGARGSDAALEQSEVVLMNDRIENFLAAQELSERARRVIRQNLVISLGTVALMGAASLTGVVPLTLGVFAHEGSTVLVCLNSLRLLVARVRSV